MHKRVRYPHVIVGGCVLCLLAYNSETYNYLLPVLMQIFGFGIFSCLSMLKSQKTQSNRIIVYTLMALNVSNTILYIAKLDLYFELSMIIVTVGVWLALWTRNCKKRNA